MSFKGAATSYVFLGGALNDGFLNSDGCYLTTTTTSTVPNRTNSITSVSDTGFVFSPTGAVCSQVSGALLLASPSQVNLVGCSLLYQGRAPAFICGKNLVH